MMRTELLVIGAGFTGLSTGVHAKKASIKSVIFEQEKSVGGLGRTIYKDGFCLDFSGHLLHLSNDYVKGFVSKLIGENLKEICRNAAIYSNGVYTRYPFQANLYGLPQAIIKGCLLEFVKAYYDKSSKTSPKTFSEWIDRNFGKGIGKHFMHPYNRKLWTVDTTHLTCDWMKNYVPKPNIDDVFNGAFSDSSKKFGYNATFWYPKKGGIQSLSDALAKNAGDIVLNKQIIAVDLDGKIVRFSDGSSAGYEKLVSTMPLKTLASLSICKNSHDVLAKGKLLRHNSVLILNVGVKGQCGGGKQWVYIPEEKYLPYRVGIYSNISKHLAPHGKSSLYIEIGYMKDWDVNRKKMSRKAIEDMIKIGIIKRKKDILFCDEVNIDCAYVIYDKNYSNAKRALLDFFRKRNVYSIGRYGNWEYSAMADAILQGKEIVQRLK